MKPENKKRNRSQQHPCWDISRVVLSQTNNGTDYINASYVCGFDQLRKFIATEQTDGEHRGQFLDHGLAGEHPCDRDAY
ncbi:unnamed protein product [Euphydryas editha]|uniref:Tyrosine-protein phosphatase domain-containing protein n=1 Tax=Euphydryas editha TaxID=104508 RepID=A0AAU9UCJ3_EUPED|nr:unnamed protein product [Euphydryas editha]